MGCRCEAGVHLRCWWSCEGISVKYGRVVRSASVATEAASGERKSKVFVDSQAWWSVCRCSTVTKCKPGPHAAACGNQQQLVACQLQVGNNLTEARQLSEESLGGTIKLHRYLCTYKKATPASSRSVLAAPWCCQDESILPAAAAVGKLCKYNTISACTTLFFIVDPTVVLGPTSFRHR